MYGRALSGYGRDAQLRHEALHDRKAHAAALLTAGREHRLSGGLHIRNAAAPVLDLYVQRIAGQDAAAEIDCPDGVLIGVDNAVCDRLGDGSLDVVHFVERRV